MKKFNSLQLKDLPYAVSKYQAFLAVLICTAALGFTAYQVSLAFSATPDLNYLSSQKEKQAEVRIKSNAQALKALRALRAAGNTTPSLETGKSDPFSL